MSRKTLDNIRRSIHLFGQTVSSTIAHVQCECYDFFPVPCAVHPHRLNWKVSGYIGGKYIAHSRTISVGTFPREIYLNQLRTDLLVQFKKQSWKWGEEIYHGPYPPLYYLQLFGGEPPVAIHKDEFHWDKLPDFIPKGLD